MTADILHPGHIRFLNRCRVYCDKLVVGLTVDDLCETQKRKPWHNYDHRREVLEALSCVTSVVPHRGESKPKAYEKLHFDLCLVGDDYFNVREYNNLIDINVRVVFIPRSESWSTTKIIKTMEDRFMTNLVVQAYGISGALLGYNSTASKKKYIMKPLSLGLCETDAVDGRDTYNISIPAPRNWKRGGSIEMRYPNIAGVNPYREIIIHKTLLNKPWYPGISVHEVLHSQSIGPVMLIEKETNVERLVRERKFPNRVFWLKSLFVGQNMKQYVRDNPDKLPTVYSKVKEIILELNSMGIVHGDVHPGNVCIDTKGKVSLIDFGWSICKSFNLTPEELTDLNKKLKLNWDLQHFKDSCHIYTEIALCQD